MRIRCPDCDAFFDVPDDRMRPGRRVRCARCHNVWTPVPESAAPEEAEQEAEQEADPDSPTGAERMPELHVPEFQAEESWPAYEPLVTPRPEIRRKERSRVVVLVAWLLSLAVLGGVVGAAYGQRSAVMRLWPPSQRVYQLVGLQAAG